MCGISLNQDFIISTLKPRAKRTSPEVGLQRYLCDDVVNELSIFGIFSRNDMIRDVFIDLWFRTVSIASMCYRLKDQIRP